MDREVFVAQYVATWLATLSANGYEERCAFDGHYKVDSIPADDAFMEAEMAWLAVTRITPESRQLSRELAESE